MTYALRNASWVAAVVAVLADGWSTEVALRAGAVEANPLIADAVHGGWLWPIILGTAAVIVVVAAPLWQPRSRIDPNATVLLWVAFAVVALWRYGVVQNNLDVAERLGYLAVPSNTWRYLAAKRSDPRPLPAPKP